MAWHKPKPKPIPHWVSQVNLILPVKPCLFLVGSVTSHHILEPMRKPIKTKTKAMAWLLLTVIWKWLSKRVLHSKSSLAFSSGKNVPPHFQAWNLKLWCLMLHKYQYCFYQIPAFSQFVSNYVISNNELDTWRAEEHSSLGSDSIKKSMSFAVREIRVANKAAWPLIKQFKNKQTILLNYLLLNFFSIKVTSGRIIINFTEPQSRKLIFCHYLPCFKRIMFLLV